MFAAALVLTFAVLAAVAGASAVLSRRLWRATPWLAPAYALLGLGIVAHLTWTLCWWSRWSCIAFSALVVTSSVVTLLADRSIRRSWRTWAPVVTLSAALLSTAVGHAFMWGGVGDPFGAAANRYRSMPGDNFLQYKFAYHLWNNLSTVQFYGDWNGSDRPPLQSGMLLIVRPLQGLFSISTDVGLTDAHALQWGLAASIVAQLIWVPGAYVLVRSLGFRRDVVVMTLVFVAVIPLSIWNVTYTWPKMMSAGFALAGLGVLVTAIRERPSRATVPVVASAALFVLAFLSHGGAAFVAPAFVVLAILALRGRPSRSWLSTGFLTVGGAALLYLPWACYGRFADPANSRLLKWHLAGVVAPNDDPLLRTLTHAYSNASVRYLVHARETNLRRVFDHDLNARLHPGSRWPDALREQDFFSPGFAIGFASVLLLVLAAIAAFAVVTRRPRSTMLDASMIVVGLSFGCMITWALVMFLPDGALVHTGTYVWLIVFAAVSFAWTASWSRLAACVVLLGQTVYAAVVYNAPGPTLTDPRLEVAPLIALAAGVVVIIALLVVVAEPRDTVGGATPSHRARERPGI